MHSDFVWLFGTSQIAVHVRRNDTAVHSLVAHPLWGGLKAIIPLHHTDYDTDAGWSRVLRAICAAEGVGFYDSHWAEEAENQG